MSDAKRKSYEAWSGSANWLVPRPLTKHLGVVPAE
jgi:hypothetical protein